jgi:DNA end-binding protein Ku
MAPIPVWSGNLRLSLVLVPIRLFPATSTEGTIAFRMIHEPSGKPIKYLKGIETKQGFEEVPEEEIIKGYEHTKGHHILIEPKEIDALKLEAKHTIDMTRFVDLDEIDSRYFEKPYYLLPDGDEADEGYTVLRDAFAKTKKMAVGQLIMHGRELLVGITAHKNGLMLVILRYADELRKPEPSYFDAIDAKADTDAVKLAVDLIEQQAGKFDPQKMPNEYAEAVHELVQAKVEQRAPEVEIETEKREAPKVVNIMDALKKSIEARGQAKVRDAVRRRMGKEPASKKLARASKSGKPTSARRSLH